MDTGIRRQVERTSMIKMWSFLLSFEFTKFNSNEAVCRLLWMSQIYIKFEQNLSGRLSTQVTRVVFFLNKLKKHMPRRFTHW